MRPTLLNFRSPKERTGDFPEKSQVTHYGDTLNFKVKQLNKRPAVLPQAERFQQYNLFKGGSKANSFLGPGTYNDHESFIKLNRQPCPSKMAKTEGLSDNDKGNYCYMMVGQNIVYDASHTSCKPHALEGRIFSESELNVSLQGAIGQRSLSQLKQHRMSNRALGNIQSRQQTFERANNSQHRSLKEESDHLLDLDRTQNSFATNAQYENLKRLQSPQSKAESLAAFKRCQVRPVTTCSQCKRQYQPLSNQIAIRPQSNVRQSLQKTDQIK